MNTKTIKTLLAIACGGLLIAACIFAGISIFGKEKNNWFLFAALGCVALGNLFNFVRMRLG